MRRAVADECPSAEEFARQARRELECLAPSAYRSGLEMLTERVVHRMLVSGQWVDLDVWAEQGRNFNDGKFGFLVQGNDEIGLSDFKFTPAR